MEKSLKETIDGLVDQNIMPVAIVSTTPFRTQRNYISTPRRYEKTDKPSMTVPDQSMTIRELVYRYTHGMSLSDGRTPLYEEEDEIQYPVDWNKLDLSERHDFITSQKEKMEEILEKQKEIENRKNEERRRKEIDDAVNQKLEAIRKGRVQGELPLEESK